MSLLRHVGKEYGTHVHIVRVRHAGIKGPVSKIHRFVPTISLRLLIPPNPSAMINLNSDPQQDPALSLRKTAMKFRVGLGHDTHRLEAGRRLVIGGIEIPHDRGPVAHSDGDVLLHALIDAILGALGWGDIGEWFPDTDEQFQGADSTQLLKEVVKKAHAEGWQIENADCIIFAQKPKLSPFKQTIAKKIAEQLGINADQINVKAKTGEKVGPVGREEAICAEVVVLMVCD